MEMRSRNELKRRYNPDFYISELPQESPWVRGGAKTQEKNSL